jgi:hypothetical protein
VQLNADKGHACDNVSPRPSPLSTVTAPPAQRQQGDCTDRRHGRRGLRSLRSQASAGCTWRSARAACNGGSSAAADSTAAGPQQRGRSPRALHQLHDLKHVAAAAQKDITANRFSVCRVAGFYRTVRTPRRSSCFMAEWMQMEGKLHSMSSLLSSFARSTLFTKMTTCGGVQGEDNRRQAVSGTYTSVVAVGRRHMCRGAPCEFAAQCASCAMRCRPSCSGAAGWLPAGWGPPHLVEVQRIQQVVQLPVLLLLLPPAARSRCSVC